MYDSIDLVAARVTYMWRIIVWLFTTLYLIHGSTGSFGAAQRSVTACCSETNQATSFPCLTTSRDSLACVLERAHGSSTPEWASWQRVNGQGQDCRSFAHWFVQVGNVDIQSTCTQARMGS